MISRKVTKVTRCADCPFFQVEGMEHLMICGHPYWNDKEPYAGAIITHDNRNGIPEKCPLRKSDSMTTQIVTLL